MRRPGPITTIFPLTTPGAKADPLHPPALPVCWLCCLVAALLAPPAFPQTDPAHETHHHHRQASAAAATRQASEADGMSIPDVTLLDQNGRQVRFYSDLVQGRTVAINSIFTTCTTICPPMGANFAKLQRLLGDRVGRDVQLISLSVDPVVDTPQRLNAWAAKFDAGPGWTLLTGPKADMNKLLKALKFFTPDKTDHSPTVLLGNDARGEWTRTYGLATPHELIRVIEEMYGPGENDRSGSRR